MPNSDHNSVECEPYSVNYTQRIGKILELRHKKDRIKRDDILVSRSHGESFRTLTTDLSRSHSRERTFGIVSSIDSTNKRSNSRERSSSLNNNNNNVIDLTNERIIKSFEKEMQLQRDIIAKERQEAALLQVKQESYINFLKNKGNSPWLPNGGGGAPYESASAHASINKSATKQGLIQKAWMRSPWPGLIKTSASTNGNSGNPSANNSFTSTVTSHKRVDDSRFAVSKIVADNIVPVTKKRSTREVSPNNRDDTLSIASSHHLHHRSSDNSSTGRLRSLSADRIMPLRSSTNERMLSRSRSGSCSTLKAGRDNRSSKYIALTVRLIDVASADASMSHGVFIVPKGCTKVELIASIEKQFNVFDKISDISITYRSGYEHKVLVKSLSMSTIEEVPLIDEYSSITVFLNGDTIFDSKGNNTVMRVVSKASLENAVLTLSSTIGKELMLKSGIDIAADSSSNKTVAVEAVGSQTRLQQQHEHKPSTALLPTSSSSSSSPSPLVDLQLLSDTGVNHHHVQVHGGNNNSQGKMNFEQCTTGISERDQLYSFSPSSASLRRCVPTNRTIITGAHPFSASSNMPLAGIASERTVNPLTSLQSRSEVVHDESAHLIQESSVFSPKRIDDRAGDNYYDYTDEYGHGVAPTSTNDNNSYNQRDEYGGGAELTIRHLTGTAHSFDDSYNDEDLAMIQLQIEINQLKRSDHSRKTVQSVSNPPHTMNSVDPPSPIQPVVSSKLIDFSEYKSKLVGSAHSKGKRPSTPSIGNAATTTSTTTSTTTTTTTTGAIVATSGARGGAGISNVGRDKKSNRSTAALKGVTKLEIERYDRVRNDDDGHSDDDNDGGIDFHPTLAPSDGNNNLLDNNNSISIDLESRDDFAIDLYDSLLNDDEEGKAVGSYLDEHIHQLRDSYFKKSSSSIIITTSSLNGNTGNHDVVEAKENSRSTSSSKHREVSSIVMGAASNHDDGDHDDGDHDDGDHDDGDHDDGDHDDDDAVKKISSETTTRIESADIQSSSLDDRLSQLQRQHTSFLRSSLSADTVHDYHVNNNMTKTNSHTLFDDGNNRINTNKYNANNNNNNNSLLPVVSTDAIDGHRNKQQSSHPRSNNRQFLSNDDHNNSFPSSSPLTDGSIHSNGIYVRHNSSERRRRDYIANKLQAKPSLSHNNNNNNNQPVLATKDYFERNQDIKSRYSAAAMLSSMMPSSLESSQMYARNTVSSSTKREYSRSNSVTERRRRSKSPSGTSSSSSTAGSRIKPNPTQSLHHHHYHVSDTTSLNSHSTNGQQVFYASALLDNNDDDYENKRGRRRNAAYTINDDYVDEGNRSSSSSSSVGGGYDRDDYYDSSAHNKHVVVVDNNHQHYHSAEETSHHSTTTSTATTEWDRRTAKHHQQLKHQQYRPAKYDGYREDTEVFQTLSSEKKTSSSSYVLDDNDYDYGDGGRNASSTQSDVDARSITRSTGAATILDNYAADDVVRDILSNTKIRGASNRQVYIKLDELLANL